MKSVCYISMIMIIGVLPCFAQFPLPSDQSLIFSGSGVCQDCHQGNETALTYNNEDISPLSYWRSTMMANAAKDPLWQAKVSAEGVENPAFQNAIENKCTTCHAPIGQTTSDWLGTSPYLMDSLNVTQNWIARDGVSCTVCHQIQDSLFGTFKSYSGNFTIDTSLTIWGPYENPFGMPMTQRTGYDVEQGVWVEKAELCATCHTLFTSYVDTTGVLSGAFPEQTPYLEWKNSQYYEQGIVCQDCHMPQIQEPLVIASRPVMGLEERSPFYKHAFVGGNQLIPDLLKNHWFDFWVTAGSANFDSTQARAMRQLREKTIELSVDTTLTADSLYLDVALTNLTGHKLPTGIPIRRMWLHVRVTHDQSIVFESGAWDASGEIVGLDARFEPHHQTIHLADEVQIYEGVMKNIQDSVTYTLIEAAGYLKDNRMPPVGFQDSHASYDTIAVVGAALFDPDFNRDAASQGTGSDKVQYILPVDSGTQYNVQIQVCYQSVTPRFLNDLYMHKTDRVDAFASVMTESNMSPVVVKDTLFSVTTPTISVTERMNLNPDSPELYANYPNPFNGSTQIVFDLPDRLKVHVVVLNVQGKKIWSYSEELAKGNHRVRWAGQDSRGQTMPSGIYICQFKAGNYIKNLRLIFLK